MNRLLIGSVVLTSLMAAPAMAADIPVKAPPRVAVFSWQGCYVGVNGGWIGSRDRYRLQPSGNYLTPTGGAPPPNAAGTGDFAANIAALTTGYKDTGSGGIVGGTLGCNVQAGHIVAGLEGDVSWTDPFDRGWRRRICHHG